VFIGEQFLFYYPTRGIAFFLSSPYLTDENWHQLLRCFHPHRRQAWAEFRMAAHDLLERHQIDPSLRRVLVNLIFSLVDPDINPCTIENLQPEHAMLLETQRTIISIDSLFFVFFATEWRTLQDRYVRAGQLPRDRNQAVNGVQATMLSCRSTRLATSTQRTSAWHQSSPHRFLQRLHLLAQIRELCQCCTSHALSGTVMSSVVLSNTRKFQTIQLLCAHSTHGLNPWLIKALA
jgi:hypothetical protein